MVPLNEEHTRWVDLPPRGQGVDVFLVFGKKDEEPKEHPISKFIMNGNDGYGAASGDVEEGEPERFPTNTFLFAGSHLFGRGEGPKRYLADDSGNIISISTFGDEVLCLPGHHAKDNGALVWEVDPTDLPEVGTEVILRLRPKQAAAKPTE